MENRNYYSGAVKMVVSRLHFIRLPVAGAHVIVEFAPPSNLSENSPNHRG